MTENMISYSIWLLVSLIFVALGIYDLNNADKGNVFGFYNISPPPKAESLTDVTAYNQAVGRLLIGAGAVFAFLGLPLLLSGDNAVLIVLVCVLGSIAWVIGMVLIYELKIMRKYRTRRK